MKKYIKNYLDYFGYCTEDFITCEATGAQANDLHHIIYRSQGGGDNVENIIALSRDAHDRAHFKKEPYLKAEELQDIHNKFMDSIKKV